MIVRSEDEPGRASAKVAVLKAFFEGAEADLPYPDAPRIRRIRLRIRAHGAQGAGIAMGRRDVVRRKPRVPRTPVALAVYRRHARSSSTDYRAVNFGGMTSPGRVQRFQPMEMIGVAVARRFRQTQARQAPQQDRQRDAHFQFRQRRADAEVNACAEGQCGLGARLESSRSGSAKASAVAIRGAQQKADLLALTKIISRRFRGPAARSA